jgi:hypothetical protein
VSGVSVAGAGRFECNMQSTEVGVLKTMVLVSQFGFHCISGQALVSGGEVSLLIGKMV